MAVQAKERTEARVMVEELIRENRAPELVDGLRNMAMTMMALGIVEAVFGVVALIVPFAAAAFTTLLVGAAVVVSGVVQMIASFALGFRSSWGKFVLGLLAIVAGTLLVAHPVYGLGFLGLLLGLYFIGSGIARMAAYRSSGWMVASGVLSVILGLIFLFGGIATSALAIGLLVGIYLIAGGLGTLSVGTRMLNRFKGHPL